MHGMIREYEALRDLIFDESSTFRVSEVFPRLVAVRDALSSADRKDERAATSCMGTLDLMSLVRSRQGNLEETIALGEACLSAQEDTFFLGEPHSPSRTALRLARAYGELCNGEQSIAFYEKCVALFDRSPDLTGTDRLSIQYDLGYHLHEGDRFADAVAQNTRLLGQLIDHLGTTQHRHIAMVHENLAQNHYELSQFEAAREHLVKALEVAEADHDREKEANLQFQLGVLAAEQGDTATARACFTRQLEIATSLDDESLIEEATRNLFRVRDH